MRNRILPIFITVFIAAMALVSIQNALAAPDSEVNTGITINEGDTNVIITDSHLKITDPVSETTPVTYTILTGPQRGNITVLTGGTFTQSFITGNNLKYSHFGSEHPADSFVFNVRNSSSVFYTGTFTINVNPVNDPPNANTDVISVTEGGITTTLFIPPGATSVTFNDTDAEGGTLTVTLGTGPTRASLFTLNGNGTFSYTHNGSETTSDSFTYTVCDDGTPMECDSSGSVTITITPVNDTPSLTISGTPTENQTLTANLSDGDGLPGSIAYQWQRSGSSGGPWSDIAGATNTTYTLGDLVVNQYVRVKATYTDVQGTAESPASAASGPIANINDTPSLTISGTPTENQTLTANLSDDDGLPALGSISYQWQRSGSSGGPWLDITGATNTTYILDDLDVNQFIRVKADYTDLHTTTESAASTASGPVANVNDIPSLTISGTPTEDQTLTANLSDDDGLPAPGSISYKWQRSGNSGGPWSDIAGATNTTYTLDDLDVNQYIRVTATYTDLHTTAESPASTASGPIVNVNDTPTLSISGTQIEDQTLTANLGDNDGLPGSISYLWQRSDSGTGGWSNIPGTTGNTYTLNDNDSSKYIRVRAFYTDQKGTSESPTSSASGPITNINDIPSLTLDGPQVEDQTLTANLADDDGLPGSISYQWQRSNTGTGGWSNIPGATSDTYTLGDDDSLKYVRVQANYTDNQGTPETPISPASGKITNVNDVPMAYPDTYYLFEGEEITRNVTINDVDVDEGDIFYFIQNPSPPYPPPSHAALFNQDSAGNITYKHDGSENFSDNFVYRICSHQNPSTITGCTQTTVTLIITPTNDAPTTVPDIFTVPRSETLDTSLEPGQTSVISNDSDAEGDNLIVNTTPITQPMYAESFTLNADGTFIYVHNDSSNDDDSFSYEVCDDGTPIECSVETVTINIGPRPIAFIFLPFVLNNYSPDEPNNGPCTAYPINLNSQYSFMPNDVEDWYRITLPGTTNLTVKVEKFALTGDLIVYRSNDCVIDSNDEVKNDGTSQSSKTVNWTNAPAGTYYIRVYTANPNPSAQAYDLVISAP